MTGARKPKRLRKKARRVWRFYAPYVRAHRRALVLGALASIGVVGARAVLPLPLAQVVASVRRLGDGDAGGGMEEVKRAVLWASAAFLALYAALGAFDLLSRTWFARFSISVVGDVRAGGMRAFASAGRAGARGDLIARLIGDTARLKDGLKGFLVHVATNGLYFLVVVVLLAFFQPRLAIPMAVGLVVILAVVAVAGTLVYRRATTLRERDGKVVNRVLESARSGASGPGELDRLGSVESSLTRIQGIAALIVYVVLGSVLGLCLTWAGTGPGSEARFVAFTSYALLLIHPVVRLARQGTRIGKLLASALRIERALHPPKKKRRKREAARVPLPALTDRIALERFSRPGGRGRRPRFGPVDLTLRPGDRVALVGCAGCGKTSLLRALAGNPRRNEGRVLWDGTELSSVARSERVRRVVLLTGTAELDAFLASRTPDHDQRDPALESEAPLSPDVLLIDDPLRGAASRDVRAGLTDTLAGPSPSVVVVALSDDRLLDLFDRVVVLAAGRVVFDGARRAVPEELLAGIRGSSPFPEESAE